MGTKKTFKRAEINLNFGFPVEICLRYRAVYYDDRGGHGVVGGERKGGWDRVKPETEVAAERGARHFHRGDRVRGPSPSLYAHRFGPLERDRRDVSGSDVRPVSSSNVLAPFGRLGRVSKADRFSSTSESYRFRTFSNKTVRNHPHVVTRARGLSKTIRRCS